jgi:hypothetical protein
VLWGIGKNKQTGEAIEVRRRTLLTFFN